MSESATMTDRERAVTIGTLVRFLFGSRDAILQVAYGRRTLLVGCFFVLSAGFAREYDAEDLWHEPWYVGIPLVASLVTSFLLYHLVDMAFEKRDQTDESHGRRYLRFLTVYWMTAPLAWLYAIPYELWTSDVGAVRLNLWTLAIVSVWRVLLITRAVCVLYGPRWWSAFVVVMFFADTLMLGILYFTPLPIFNVMGGIRLSASESLIQGMAMMVGFLGGASWLVWFIGTGYVSTRSNDDLTPAQPEAEQDCRVQPSLWALVAASLLVWVVVLPQTQPKQRLRRQVEHLLTNDGIEQAVAIMSAHDLSDFPPHWQPPPHEGYAHPHPPLIDVLEVLAETETAPWVREAFLARVCESLSDDIRPVYFRWFSIHDQDEIDRYLAVFIKTPEALEAIRGNMSGLLVFADRISAESETGRQVDRLERVRALLRAVGYEGEHEVLNESGSEEDL